MVISPGTSDASSEGLGETPPHLLGTSFGYHFTNPRILERRGSSTLPRQGHGKRRGDDLASAIWSRWKHAAETPEDTDRRPQMFGEGMGRTQSEVVPGPAGRIQSEEGPGIPGRTQSDGAGPMGQRLDGGWGNREVENGVRQDERGSWGRSRGYSVV
jgi:hypothetical protein